MQSLFKLILVKDGTPEGLYLQKERRRRVRVEDYLDHICAPLVGILPYEERFSLRTETEEHLYALIEDRESEGLSYAEATEAALKEHGEPWRIGQNFADAWCRSQMPQSGALSRYMSAATLRAFAFFGFASVVSILTLQFIVLTPSAYSLLMPWFVLYVCVSPLIAGAMTGVLVPVRSARAVAMGMGIVLVHTGAVALLLWPQQEGMFLLAAEAFGWLPFGMLAATLSAAASRHKHRTLFLRRWVLR